MAKYDSDSIKVLSDIEHIRRIIFRNSGSNLPVKNEDKWIRE